MRLYRIAPERFLEVYSGTGGSYQDGARWNVPGIPVVYFATSPGVALLEMSHYLPSPRLVPRSYRLGIYELPSANSEQWEVETLPVDWNRYPYPASTQALGTAWLRQRASLVLLVPSCAVPGGLENIAVVNPLHPAVDKIMLIDTREAIYNPRTFQGP
ncbi:RES domain-containing protein [Modicisalibacter muralis]|uniref:RES domain-containing protein n=1 Tax=Modicisalibacter muralis TaxID=119000 RepID=A0A1G9RL79_9GAMM|nr:RES family NAD+ phosphorylase [Halomonas muralis]SDM23810.1 RES domain-containing protein [Halomonas muralis]